jgi:hypothetical protein
MVQLRRQQMILLKGKCDVCNKEFQLENGGFSVIRDTSIPGRVTLAIGKVHEHEDNASVYNHVCGLGCLLEFIAKLVTAQIRNEPKEVPNAQ